MAENVPKNVQIFNLYALKIFARAYEAFPRACEFDYQEMALGEKFDPLQHVTQEQFNSDRGQPKVLRILRQKLKKDERVRSCIDTAYWLEQNDFLLGHHDHKRPWECSAMLTHKGLVAMQVVPGGLAGEFSRKEMNFGDVVLHETGQLKPAIRDALVAAVLGSFFK